MDEKGSRGWLGQFRLGETVEYVGPELGEGWPLRGDRGTIITPGEVGDPPPMWVVDFEAVTAVFAADDLRPIEGEHE